MTNDNITENPEPDDAELWQEYLDSAFVNQKAMPSSLMDFMREIAAQVSEFGNTHRTSLSMMTVAVASLFGALALTAADGDPNNDEAINTYLLYADAALHVATAHMRAANGYKAPTIN